MSAAMAPWPYPFWIAHRGAGKLAPENTLAAFRVGASHGYRAFECDVKLSADGVPFLLHDATLERTTMANGVAGERAWSDLSRLDAGLWHSSAFAGEALPSLDAIGSWVQHNGCSLNIEIKPTPGHEVVTGEAVAQACLRLWHDHPHLPLLSSFRPDALQSARSHAPAMPRALLIDSSWPGWLDAALSLGCVAVVSRHTLMEETLIAQLHRNGLRALCYTVNDAAEARRLLALGVDGLITDAVDRFAPVEGAVCD